MRYLCEYILNKEKSVFNKSNLNKDQMLKDFGGTEILSFDEKFINFDDKNCTRIDGNVKVCNKTGIKRLQLEEHEDEPCYFIFMFYFR